MAVVHLPQRSPGVRVLRLSHTLPLLPFFIGRCILGAPVVLRLREFPDSHMHMLSFAHFDPVGSVAGACRLAIDQSGHIKKPNAPGDLARAKEQVKLASDGTNPSSLTEKGVEREGVVSWSAGAKSGSIYHKLARIIFPTGWFAQDTLCCLEGTLMGC